MVCRAHDPGWPRSGWDVAVSGDTPGAAKRSLESQARFLESVLGHILDEGAPLEALFVYRWRDVDAPLPTFHRAERDPYRATYGIIDDDGTPRPAMSVVAGFYRGSQQAFAFPTGDLTYREWPWDILAMWTVLLMLALLYAFSARFRHTVPRYFLAHGFYRDSVREGRNVLFLSSLTMLIALALSSGVALGVTVDILGQETGFRILASWLPDRIVALLGSASSHPIDFLLIVAALYAAIEFFWILMLVAVSRARGGLGAGQAMLIAVWPRGPLIVFAVILLAIAHGAVPGSPVIPVLIVSALWIGATLWSVTRAVVDFALVSRMPGIIALVLGVLHPFVAALIVVGLIAFAHQERLEFVARVAGLL
jgi:hypothetical protein